MNYYRLGLFLGAVVAMILAGIVKEFSLLHLGHSMQWAAIILAIVGIFYDDIFEKEDSKESEEKEEN
jgi:uncharacterized membrane protein YvlD (DUF360 family)